MDSLIHFDRYAAVVIGTVKGATVLDTANSELLGQALDTFADANPGAHLLLNLHHVEYISSAVLNKLILAKRQLEQGGGGLRVAGLHDYTLNVFRVTRLDEEFHAEPNVQHAAEAYLKALAGD